MLLKGKCALQCSASPNAAKMRWTTISGSTIEVKSRGGKEKRSESIADRRTLCHGTCICVKEARAKTSELRDTTAEEDARAGVATVLRFFRID